MILISAVRNILIGCGTLSSLGIIVLIGLSYYGYTQFKEGFSQEPAHVQQVARSIMDYDFPEGKGVGSAEFGFKGAVLVYEDYKIMLVLLSFPQSWPESIIKVIKENPLFNVSSQDTENLEIKSITKEERILCDQKVKLVSFVT